MHELSHPVVPGYSILDPGSDYPHTGVYPILPSVFSLVEISHRWFFVTHLFSLIILFSYRYIIALDLAGKEAKRILQWIQLALSSGMREARPWANFFEKFSFPKLDDWAAFEKRVYTNLWYWRSNYAFIIGILYVYQLFFNTSMMLTTLILVPLWISLIGIRGQTNNGTIKMGTTVLSSQQILMGLVFISVFIIYISNTIFSIMFITGASLFCILLHAGLRPASTKANLSKAGADISMRMNDMFHGNNNNNQHIDPEAPVPYNNHLSNQPISPMDAHRANLQYSQQLSSSSAADPYPSPQYPPMGSNNNNNNISSSTGTIMYDNNNNGNGNYQSSSQPPNQLRNRPTGNNNNIHPPSGYLSAADAALDAADRTAAELQATLQASTNLHHGMNSALPRPTTTNKKE